MDLKALKSRLADRAEALVVGLLGEPTARRPREWRWGRKGSLVYDFEHQRWHSFASERGGDLLDLIQFGNPGCALERAMAWAQAWLGTPVDSPVRPTPRQRARRQAVGTKLALRLGRESAPASRASGEAYV